MKENPYRENKEEIDDLLKQYENLKTGRSQNFLKKKPLKRSLNFLMKRRTCQKALEAAELGSEQYPFLLPFLSKKLIFYCSLRRYQDALKILEQAELFDGGDINLYILENGCLPGP